MREAVLAGHTSNHIHAYAAMRLSHVQPPFVVSLSSFISLCHEGVSRFRHLFFPTVLIIISSLPPSSPSFVPVSQLHSCFLFSTLSLLTLLRSFRAFFLFTFFIIITIAFFSLCQLSDEAQCPGRLPSPSAHFPSSQHFSVDPTPVLSPFAFPSTSWETATLSRRRVRRSAARSGRKRRRQRGRVARSQTLRRTRTRRRSSRRTGRVTVNSFLPSSPPFAS
jgi:hypothetical protein